jgi:hypothetical protein
MKRSPPDIRKLILARLKEMDRSKLWLSHKQTTAHSTTAYSYLCGRSVTSAEVVAEMMFIVGLRITAKRLNNI